MGYTGGLRTRGSTRWIWISKAVTSLEPLYQQRTIANYKRQNVKFTSITILIRSTIRKWASSQHNYGQLVPLLRMFTERRIH